MAGIPINPDLPLSWRRPGSYVSINLNNPGSGPAQRLLIMGEHDSSGLAPGQSLYRANNETDVINGSGANSVNRMLYNAAIAQVGGGVMETWIANVDQASAGTAAIYTFQILIPGTNPTGSGYVNWSMCGRTASVGFTAADTVTTIAANLVTAALLAFATLPVATITSSSGIITVTMKTKAAWTEDMPSVYYVSPNLGVYVGSVFVYATNCTGIGSSTITHGRNVYTVTTADGETPTTLAAALAALLVGDIALSGTAIAVSAGTLTIVFNNNWPIRHVVGKIVTSTGTTIAVDGAGGVAAGTSAPNGTLGAASPTTTLATMLTVLDGQSLAFTEYVCPWNDTTTLGTIDAQLETEGGGLLCRNQRINVASVASLATAGGIPTGTSPALTASTRGCVVAWVAYESPNSAFEFSARIAAAKAANSYPQKNFNGLQFKTSTAAPLLGPPPSGRSPGTDINSAIQSYFMAPIRWDDNIGRPIVEHSRTTSNSADRALHKWSLFAQLDAQRAYLIQGINAFMAQPDGTGASLMPSGVPFTQGIITIDDIKDCIYRLTVEMEKLGFYYGADANKAGINAVINPSNANRIDCVYTASVLIDVDQISVVANRQAA